MVYGLAKDPEKFVRVEELLEILSNRLILLRHEVQLILHLAHHDLVQFLFLLGDELFVVLQLGKYFIVHNSELLLKLVPLLLRQVFFRDSLLKLDQRHLVCLAGEAFIEAANHLFHLGVLHFELALFVDEVFDEGLHSVLVLDQLFVRGELCKLPVDQLHLFFFHQVFDALLLIFNDVVGPLVEQLNCLVVLFPHVLKLLRCAPLRR